MKELAKDIFATNCEMDYKNSWEFFKYKVRSNAIKRSKELKKIKTEKELDLEIGRAHV